MDTVYLSLRQELLATDEMLHAFTLIVFLALIIGAWVCEKQKTILSVLLPILSLAWAASVVRFDFFIHRLGAYLRPIEANLLRNSPVPPWEIWKSNLAATRILIPIADVIAFGAILATTSFILIGPTRGYFEERGWRGSSSYTTAILLIMVALFITVAFIPRLSSQ
jgi:hypothetical protein